MSAISASDPNEYENLENKLSLNEWREAVESAAAFATAQGGTIRVGVDPKTGELKGVQIGQTTLEDLANKIKMNTSPSQFPSIVVAKTAKEEWGTIFIHCEESPIKPVWAFNIPFKRVGRTNQKLSPEETKRLMEITTGRTWDALPRAGFFASSIDRSLVQSFLRRAGQDMTTTENVLESLALLTHGAPCNAAILLFSSTPQNFFPQAQVKCARFEGTTSVKFLDQQTIDGDVLTQLDAALSFVSRNTQQAIRITGKAERDTLSEYPLEAIREALANAICHRDYTESGSVQVRIYSDRLEIWNPGLLSSKLSIADLYQEHPSHPRNPNLAKALYKARVIEQWGTGTLRIVQACENRKMARPEFRSEMGMFKVRFEHPSVPLELPQTVPLTERQQEAVAYVQRNGQITTLQYQETFRLSERTARRDLKGLVDAGVLRSADKGPATFYILAAGIEMRE